MKYLLIASVGLLLLTSYSRLAAADDFFNAYQKEYAFLEAEKKALIKRLGAIDDEAEKKESAARAELQALQSQLLAIHNKADAIEMDLDETERDNTDMEEREDMLIETMSRAKETLEQYGFELAAPSENVEVQATQIINIFKAAGQAHDIGATVARSEGSFFLMNGNKVDGEIVTIGHVAAYGISKSGSGALAPAGNGKYKLWNSSTGTVAKNILAGKFPKELPIFLYESMEKPVEHKEEKTWKEIVDSGGIIAWIIVWLGVVAILMVLARIVILAIAGMRTDKLIKTVGEFVNRGEIDKALSKCKKAKGAAAHVLRVTIENLHKEREKLDDIVSEAILNKAPMVDRFNTSILVAASVVPLLGLLGTVTGMISTFDIITEHGTGDPKMLSGGISEALVTTELGLIVAIPTLLFGTLLSGRASAIMDAMERAALQIINIDDVKNKNKKNLSESSKNDAEKQSDSENQDVSKQETDSQKSEEVVQSPVAAEAAV
ncbi:MAG: MotA/TolQ/ExbB proton channel family protein [Deltaproteobacteria bacterium]|nr:MotA/TolQ/ExbB proton channel family protein [Deltaproteobacteria bacterium]MBN2671538.1 MotA/TolQ/ExbB proton channel family protein [Deltaproteobacteria bacterium]